ncbi:DNA polymerase [Kitasatospora sp. NPDC127111]|uniref:DNA polymerase n=1 Tax=Kitasatospora sp. NPDC127111 TaxID=3345363 RepID=UPI003630899F
MITYEFPVREQLVPVHVVLSDDDRRAFREWVIGQAREGRRVAVDTEATGLDTFSPGFRLRVVQFGTEDVAYVLPVDYNRQLQELAAWALETLPSLLMFNAPFDCLVMGRHLPRVTLESLWPKTTDGYILAHLCDPRQRLQGGVGNKLKERAEHHIDPLSPDQQKELIAEFHKIGKTKDTGWAHISLTNKSYLTYAGADVILTSRLVPKLEAELQRLSVNPVLVPFEHQLALICAIIERRGMRINRETTGRLSGRLAEEAVRYAETASRYGVANVNSTRQLSEALLGMGETIPERTASGAVQVDKTVLMRLADVDKDWQPIGSRTGNPLAMAVLRSKRAGKWRVSYAEAMLAKADADDRVHPKIGALMARTARMSVADPPFQQLPSGDWTVRHCVEADEGRRMISVDFSSVEPRVMAALSEDPVMTAAILRGADLHNLTAESVFGADFTSGQRKVAKVVQLGVAYGGGAKTIAAQTGLTLPAAQAALKGYKRTYPTLARYIRALQRQVQRDGYELRTPSGRRLVFDRDAAYASFNGEIQSTARDIFAQGMLEIQERGLTPYVLAPIHDEIVADAPAAEAEDVAREIGEAMRMTFRGIPIDTDPDVGGRSWGSLYMKKAETMIEHDSWYATHPDAAQAAELARA